MSQDYKENILRLVQWHNFITACLCPSTAALSSLFCFFTFFFHVFVPNPSSLAVSLQLFSTLGFCVCYHVFQPCQCLIGMKQALSTRVSCMYVWQQCACIFVCFHMLPIWLHSVNVCVYRCCYSWAAPHFIA